MKEFSKGSLLLFWGNMMFDSEDGSQVYLIFQPVYRYFKTFTNTNYISLWKSGSCLKQSKITYTHKKVLNIYIVYELSASSSNFDDPTLKSCLFGAVTLTKNADIDKYRYSGYGIGFDRKGSFSFPGGGFGQNVIIFGADMSSSIHIDNKGKDI